MRIEQWLEKVGFAEGNPFANQQADAEGDELQSYFVQHPAYQALQADERSRSVLLAAPRGFGKTTARRMFEAFCAANAANLRPLLISLTDWDWATRPGRPTDTLTHNDYLDEILRQAVAALGRAARQGALPRPRDLDSAGYLAWLCANYGAYLGPDRQHLSALLSLPDEPPAHAPESYNLNALAFSQRLQRFVALMRALNFDICYILVDRVDEWLATTGSWSHGAQLLAPLVATLPLLETPGLVLRCFVPLEIVAVLRRRRLLRDDRIKLLELSWEGPAGAGMLREMLRARVGYYSNYTIRSLTAIVEPSLATIDEDLVELAAGSPRRLLHLGDLLLRTCAAEATDADDQLLIAERHLEHVAQLARQGAGRPPSADWSEPELSVEAHTSPPPEPPGPAPAEPLQQPESPSLPLLSLWSDGSIRRGGIPIDRWDKLPPKQRRLLDYLYANRGRRCEKEQLISAIWSGEELNDESSLRRLADRLIAFLELDPKQPLYLKKIVGGHLLLANTAGPDEPRR